MVLDPAYEKDILVEPQWLEEHLGDPGIRIIDLRTWPILVKAKVAAEMGENIWQTVEEDYLDGHIPGAVLMDPVGDMVDLSMEDIALIASPQRFTDALNRVGIGNDTLVIVYDDSPLPIPAARFWWTLRYYGHTRSRVLAGGFLQWKMENRPLSTSRENPGRSRSPFAPRIQPELRSPKEVVFASLRDPGVVIVDTMDHEYFIGSSPYPWSVRPGRIPGAICLPWPALGMGFEKAISSEAKMETMTGLEALPFLPAEKLRALFAEAGVRSDHRIITYCGRGYAAPTVLLGMKLVGFQNVAVYDGGIAEWTRDPELPLEPCCELPRK
jgi:thiosulfate/3-mercaptopyruvate sulfurtransferase